MASNDKNGDPAEFGPDVSRLDKVGVLIQLWDKRGGIGVQRAWISEETAKGPTDVFRDVIGEIALAARRDMAREKQ